MGKLVNLARMTTLTTGGGTVTLASAVAGFLSFAAAGVANGDVVSYSIRDGNNSEAGIGTYTASGTTLTRTPTTSTNANNPILLSGNAEVVVTPLASDFFLTVGSTPISGGTNGGILFQAGGALQQDGAFTWDNSAKVLMFTTGKIVSNYTASAAGSAVDGSANEFPANIEMTCNSTSSLANYEKIGLFVRAYTNDPSDTSTPITRDAVAGDFRGQINTGNMTGRTWGIFAASRVQTGADGYTTAIEADVGNNGSDQISQDTSTTKNAIFITSSGPNDATAAIWVASNGGRFHNGFMVKHNAISANGYYLFYQNISGGANFSVDNYGGTTINAARTIASATAAALDDLKVAAATTTITGATGSPITRLAKVGFYRPTLTDSTVVTVTDAATVYIENAPAAAGSVTLTNTYALLVGAGLSKFNDVVTIQTNTQPQFNVKDVSGTTIGFYASGDFTSFGTVTNHNFNLFTNNGNAQLQIDKGGYVKVTNNNWFGVISNNANLPQCANHTWMSGATTNAIVELARISIDSSGTPAVGLGASLTFEIMTASTPNREIGAAVQAVCESVTATAERITLQGRQMAAGALQDPEGLTFFFRSLTANAAYSNVNTVQPWFPSTGTITLKASTSYEFEGVLMMTNGTTSHTVGLSFGGTATLTSIAYVAVAGIAVVNGTAATFNSAMVAQAANTVVTSAITVAGTQIKVRGIVRINAAGTFIPQFTFSAAPGAGNILANSFFKMREFGNNTNTTQGAWA